jgi:branched-chain amino acid transport system permease protein
MISFGHAIYLGIGAYCVGIPAYYELYDGLLHLPLAIATSALFALVTGYICLRTRGVYFIMITLAFAQMAYFAFISVEEYGGDDGLVIELRSKIPGAIVDLESSLQLYYVIFAFLLGSLFLVHRIVNSRFGMVIQGAKGNDERMQAIGFNTFRYRLICYVIAGAMCGTAGWLLGNFNNFFSPEMIGWTRSGELIFMVVLGGAGTLFGPVLGAIAFVVLEEVLSSYTIYWPLIFGPFLIFVVLFAREGLEGLFSKLERGPT